MLKMLLTWKHHSESETESFILFLNIISTFTEDIFGEIVPQGKERPSNLILGFLSDLRHNTTTLDIEISLMKRLQ